MQTIAQIFFWGSTFAIIYTWLLYPMILFIISRLKRVAVKRGDIIPSVSFIITVHNEEKVIEKKIENALALDYPEQKLEIIVASDASTDRTNELVSRYFDRGVKLYLPQERKGKSVTQNEAVATAQGEIIVLGDADTMFDRHFIREIVKNFDDPKVGCATGVYTNINPDVNSITSNIGFFWKFELLLRDLESRIGILFTTSGACMALRKNIFVPMDRRFADDGVIALDVVLQGYRVVNDKKAIAFITHPTSKSYQFNLRKRVIIRNVPCLLSRGKLLNPIRYPHFAFAIISHRFLRWLTPFFMIATFLSNTFLLSESFYQLTYMFQAVFYICAIIGSALEKRNTIISAFSAPYSFCIGNAGFLVGFIKLLKGEEIYKYR